MALQSITISKSLTFESKQEIIAFKDLITTPTNPPSKAHNHHIYNTSYKKITYYRIMPLIQVDHHEQRMIGNTSRWSANRKSI